MIVSSGWCSPNLYIGKWVGKSPNLHPLENGLFRVPGIHVVEASKLSTFGYVVVMIEVVGSMSLPPTLMGVKDVPETSFGGENHTETKKWRAGNTMSQWTFGSDNFGSHFIFATFVLIPKTNKHFKDVSPTKSDDFPLPCLFSGHLAVQFSDWWLSGHLDCFEVMIISTFEPSGTSFYVVVCRVKCPASGLGPTDLHFVYPRLWSIGEKSPDIHSSG